MADAPDLYSTIEDSISDAELPLEAPEIDTPASDDIPTEVVEPTTTDSDPVPEVPESTLEVKSPAARPADQAKVDDFEKRFGIPQNSSSGRENRIPYSRVKKITEKAEKDTDTRIRAEYAPKLSEFETKVKDYETKVADYEGRLKNVAQIEQMMVNDHVGFLQTLIDKVPGYAQILAPLYQQQVQPDAAKTAPVDPSAEMPKPDAKFPDGSLGYSTAGHEKLLAWHREQARKEALADVDKRYGKVLESYTNYEQQQQLYQATLPKVEAQINEARKWPKFVENEAEIVKALTADKSLSLEGAYRQVVLPALTKVQDTAAVDKTKLEQELRTKILAELKATPKSTSATSRPTQPGSRTTTSGSRSIESIIEEQIKTLKQ